VNGISPFPARAAVLWAAAAALALSGCAAAGPTYVRPEVQTPAAFHAQVSGGSGASAADPGELSSWWVLFGDPQLTRLIERTAEGNLDLRQAQARVREARARRIGAQAGAFPTLQARGSAVRSGSIRAEEAGGGSTARSLYSGSFDAGWEADLFGGVRRSVEAAGADLQAREEEFRDVLVSLAAEVALNYVEVRTGQSRLREAEANLARQEETLGLAEARYEAGVTDALAVDQARANLEATRAQVPNLRTGVEEAKNRLAVLLGSPPGAVHDELADSKPVPLAAREAAVGVPADLLRRRPDVRASERNLAAQTARVGVATAELYPKLTLSGSIGLETLSAGSFFSALTRLWSFGPRITWPAFDAGAIRANIEIQSAGQERAFAAYESAILNALEQVENALTAYAEEQIRLEALREAARAASSGAELAERRYEAGLIDFLGVLDAQRSRFSAEDQLAQSQGAVTSNLIRLYKALGGGWTHFAEERPKG
jgi:outer membrane protein, multidrug efflux system